jgi:hypothetical protein
MYLSLPQLSDGGKGMNLFSAKVCFADTERVQNVGLFCYHDDRGWYEQPR